jgi:hypothetical protein
MPRLCSPILRCKLPALMCDMDNSDIRTNDHRTYLMIPIIAALGNVSATLAGARGNKQFFYPKSWAFDPVQKSGTLRYC